VAIGALVAGLIALLLVLGLTAGDDEGGRREGGEEREHRGQREEKAATAPTEIEADQVSVRLVARSDVQVCLLGQRGRALIDAETLSPGTERGPFDGDRFEIRFDVGLDPGQIALFVNGDRQRLPDTLGPVAYRIAPPGRVRPIDYPGPGCL
jgi:hypothetical protein